MSWLQRLGFRIIFFRDEVVPSFFPRPMVGYVLGCLLFSWVCVCVCGWWVGFVCVSVGVGGFTVVCRLVYGW